MASLQVINVSDRGVRASRVFNLTPTRIRTPAEILEEQGRDMAHEIKLLKRRLRYAYTVQTPRAFPSGYASVADYISRFCSLNHLKEC